jgi:hypothetical protein
LIAVLSAAIFVFVGVDSNHFRYVLDFEVTVQGLVGDVPGGTADHSEHFWLECLEDHGVGWLAASPQLYP